MINLLKAINLILASIMFLYYKYLVWRSKKDWKLKDILGRDLLIINVKYVDVK